MWELSPHLFGRYNQLVTAPLLMSSGAATFYLCPLW
jgi:hypothetical protein